MKKKSIIAALCILLSVFSVITIVSANAATYINYEGWKLEIPSATNNTEYYLEGYTGSATNIVIPANVGEKTIVKINGNAFSDSSAVSVTVPETVTRFDSYAFSGCKTLVSVTVPSSLTYLGSSAFANCTALKTVDFPEVAKFPSIAGSCFSGCSALEEVSVPYGVENIYNYAFLNCTSLKKVTIPPSVTNIAAKAFNKCPNVTLYVYDGSYALQYAQEYLIPYVNLGEFAEPTVPTEPTATATSSASPDVTTTIAEVTTTIVTDPVVTTTVTAPASSVVTEPSSAAVTSTAVTEPTESSASTTSTESTSSTAADSTEASSSVAVTTDATEASSSVAITTDATEVSSTAAVTSASASTSASTTTVEKLTYLIGDSDLDGRITIKDATRIQKHIAKMLTLDNIPLTLSDADGDGRVSVKDATQIQKFIAGFKDILYVGTEVKL